MGEGTMRLFTTAERVEIIAAISVLVVILSPHHVEATMFAIGFFLLGLSIIAVSDGWPDMGLDNDRETRDDTRDGSNDPTE